MVISGNEVEVYEKGSNRVIIRGNFISKPLREAFRRHTGTAVTIAATAVAAAASVILLSFPQAIGSAVATGFLERFSTAMLATLFVSAAALTQVWFSLRRKSQIEWVAVSTT